MRGVRRWVRAVLAVLILAFFGSYLLTRSAQVDELANLFSQMSQLYRDGRYAEAIPIAERYAKAIAARHGNDGPKYALALNELAHGLQAVNRFTEAEPLMRRALAIDEEKLGPDHINVAVRLNNLASLLRATNRLSEAEPMFIRALAIREKALPAEHSDIALSLNNLAGLYQEKGRFADAEPLFNRALAIRELLGKEQGMFVDRKEIGKPGAFDALDDEELQRAIELLHAEVAEYEQKLLPPLKKGA